MNLSSSSCISQTAARKRCQVSSDLSGFVKIRKFLFFLLLVFLYNAVVNKGAI